jgi:signal transduction histidine kinase
MRECRDEERREGESKQHRRQRRRRHRHALAPEPLALRAAQRRANLRLGFVAHLVPYGAVCFFLLAVAGLRVALIVALAWGIGVACHYFFALIAPDLRRRFIDEEVGRELRENSPRERQSTLDRHARSLEELSASIAHEIRNPIAAARSLVQQMGEDPASRENVANASVALEELDRVERSISHLLRFAREEEVELRDMHLRDALDSALESMRDRLTRLGVEVERELDSEGPMRGDSEKLRRVLLNLLGNALDAFEEAATKSPRLCIEGGENLAGTEVWLRIRDNGPGIEAGKLAVIFSPFYTSKQQGTGLGLAISKKLVDAHGGSLEVRSAPGAGAEFLLAFPKSAAGGR